MAIVAGRLPRKARPVSRAKTPICRATVRSRDRPEGGRSGPGTSRIGNGTRRVTSAISPATNTNVALNPISGVRRRTPEPPSAFPIDCPPNMSPFASPRSSSRKTPTASASMATSCVAAKTLWTKTIAVKSQSRVAKSTGIAARIVTTIMAWVRRIHPRRRPQRLLESTSTNGPNAHFTAHGR